MFLMVCSSINITHPGQIAAPTCGTCDLSLFRPFVCLHCDYAGCWSDNHVVNHLREEGHLFCSFMFIFPCLNLIHRIQVWTQRQDTSTALSATISYMNQRSTMYLYPRLSTLKKSTPGSKVRLSVQESFLLMIPKSAS